MMAMQTRLIWLNRMGRMNIEPVRTNRKRANDRVAPNKDPRRANGRPDNFTDFNKVCRFSIPTRQFFRLGRIPADPVGSTTRRIPYGAVNRPILCLVSALVSRQALLLFCFLGCLFLLVCLFVLSFSFALFRLFLFLSLIYPSN